MTTYFSSMEEFTTTLNGEEKPFITIEAESANTKLTLHNRSGTILGVIKEIQESVDDTSYIEGLGYSDIEEQLETLNYSIGYTSGFMVSTSVVSEDITDINDIESTDIQKKRRYFFSEIFKNTKEKYKNILDDNTTPEYIKSLEGTKVYQDETGENITVEVKGEPVSYEVPLLSYLFYGRVL